jgi:hypothetical protein
MQQKNGNLENIKWLINKGFNFNKWTYFKALENGNLENVEFLVKEFSGENVKFTDKSQTIKYLIEHQYLAKEDLVFFKNAVIKGNLGMMKLLFENGFEYPKDIFNYAADRGDLEVMKCLLKNNFPFYNAFELSIDNLDNIKWLHENKCPFNKNILSKVIKLGNIDVIEWMLEKKFPIC